MSVYITTLQLYVLQCVQNLIVIVLLCYLHAIKCAHVTLPTWFLVQ